MEKGKSVRKKRVKKQTKVVCSKSIQNFDGRLPPILPEVQFPYETLSDSIGSHARRRMDLTWRAYSAAVYAHEEHFAERIETLISEPTNKLFKSEKELILNLFDRECFAVLGSVREFLGKGRPIPPAERIALFKDYQAWMKQLKELLREALFAQELESWKQDFISYFQNSTPDDPADGARFRHLVRKPVFSKYKYRLKFLDLFYAQLKLDQGYCLMIDIVIDWIDARMQKKVETKKRGHGILNKQVGELLDSMKWPTDITAPDIKKTLDKINIGTYSDTSADAIRDTPNWEKLQKKKQQHKKK